MGENAANPERDLHESEAGKEREKEMEIEKSPPVWFSYRDPCSDLGRGLTRKEKNDAQCCVVIWFQY